MCMFVYHKLAGDRRRGGGSHHHSATTCFSLCSKRIFQLWKNTCRITFYKVEFIAERLKNVDGCKIKQRIFYSLTMSQPTVRLSKNVVIEKADFSKNENAFTIYLLELPLRTEGFKLVLVLPNESTVVKTLFSTLSNQGLAAAINSIQPLFTGKAELMMPISIDVTSRIELNETKLGSPVQYGTITVSDKGAEVRLLTCLYSPASEMVDNEAVTSLQPGQSWPPPPFYFALVYRDTPIFYGDFNKPIIRATDFKNLE
ncbi:hypothetical protein HF086_014337 [Spodoptera exigua]|uniref:Serpin domain-containing protein n=1 Tax=Spodoptera exigua TaxID=7107 RepID=A0A922SBW8_SPOEX|nr:hypothetical protein HF086_014337 [Spodoptera exigua]